VGEDPTTGLFYGVSAMQGWRAQMEDDHLHLLSLPEVGVRAAHRARPHLLPPFTPLLAPNRLPDLSQ